MKFFKLLVAVMFFAGCSTSASNQRGTDVAFNTDSNKVAVESEVDAIPSSGRVILFNANITIETDDTDALSSRITSLAATYGGYVVSTSSGLVVIRVQADKFDSAVEEIKKSDEDAEVRIFSEDVTGTFRDTQIRLDNKIKARDRYLELLKRAENVPAALEVERELERLNVEIEELKGQINRLSHLARYSTISVRIEEEVKPGPLGYLFYGTYRAVKWLFIRN